MQTIPYRFRPRLIPTIITVLLLPLLINLGLWQTHKAERKQALQDIYDRHERESPLQIGAQALNPSAFRYSRVLARGRYDPAFQILLDNQMNGERAGYHVITPLQIEGQTMRVLVNRGWVPVGADRRVLPPIETPAGIVEVRGYAVAPSAKFFELAKPKDVRGQWQTVWQNLDMRRYQAGVPFPLQPVVIRLDAGSTAGGYVREWVRPDSRIEVHRGYALQWFGMAAVLVLFYLASMIKKTTNDRRDHE